MSKLVFVVTFKLYNVDTPNTLRFSVIFVDLYTFKLFSIVVLPLIDTFLAIPIPPLITNTPVLLLDESSVPFKFSLLLNVTSSCNVDVPLTIKSLLLIILSVVNNCFNTESLLTYNVSKLVFVVTFKLYNVDTLNTLRFSVIFVDLNTFKLFSTVVFPPIKAFLAIPIPPCVIIEPLVILDESSL